MAIGERIHFLGNKRGMTYEIFGARLSAFPKRAQMCVWLSMKQELARRKQT